ncbi:hypothetical protein [Streptomyces canus]|uniref:hypothetical protein n=1 Tax=Streptomyces canus TaxID=58343 RepID=UPI0027841583|nr:hypothetical protein [Streptomyces canus]MDQ0757756.1 chromosome segregation ATPase [Streptomyces canus]
MVSASRTAHSIEVTAEGLQEELARLHFQKQTLERELAAIVAHLGSVQRALGALESALVAPRSAEQVDEPDKQYGKLTEQIVAYFAKVGDAEVRAREVAAALGRDADSGSINAVRSTLDRLVASSRIERAGRGLYRTGRS